jgi:hypothetical protein
METVILSIMIAGLFTIFALDIRQKRRTFRSKGKQE